MSLPAVPGAFYWTEESWGAALRCRPLDPLAPHLFTTRHLTLSRRDDERALHASLGVRRVVLLRQVHGAAVTVIRRSGTLPDSGTPGDALVSNVAEVGVGVRSADCVPLLMADAATGAVAAVHAGWRGTAAGAAGAAVSALAREFGSRPGDLVAAIGPHIGPCCYEVGTELVDAFAAAGHHRDLIDRWFLAPPPPRGARERPPLRLDLGTANRDQLILSGLEPEHIHMSGLCTAEHLDVLTSYRTERAAAGRMIAVIAGPSVR
jgi:hypothetical protein